MFTNMNKTNSDKDYNKIVSIVTSGYTRDVLLIHRWALKFPAMRNGWRAFLMGLMGNIKEYETWSTSQHPNLARLTARIGGGWLNIYCRYQLLDRPLTSSEIDCLPVYGHDPKVNNYGVDDEGAIIVLDYGHNACWPKYMKAEVDELYELGILQKV